MRRFYLQNETGARLDLTGNYETSGIFLADPEGLGSKYSDTFMSMQTGFFTRTFISQSQEPLKGTLIFLDPAYKRYQDFTRFVYRAKTLFLVYIPIDETEYYCQVSLKSIGKGQLSTQEASLHCPVEWNPWTLWYTLNEIRLAWGSSDAESRYPGQYLPDARYSNLQVGVAKAVARGTEAAALKIIVKGQCVDPVLTCFGTSSGAQYGECAITGTFAANEGFVLQTKYQDSYIRMLLNDNETEDLLNAVDITKNVFFRIPVEEECTVQVSGGNELTIEGFVYDYYRSV